MDEFTSSLSNINKELVKYSKMISSTRSATNKPQKDNQSANSSDSDDWTLLSAPHSSASSSDPLVSTFETVSKDTPSSSLPADHLSLSAAEANNDDGLTEIDLNNDATSLLLTGSSSIGNHSSLEDDKRKKHSPVPGFTALDTTDDDELPCGQAQMDKKSVSWSDLEEAQDTPAQASRRVSTSSSSSSTRNSSSINEAKRNRPEKKEKKRKRAIENQLDRRVVVSKSSPSTSTRNPMQLYESVSTSFSNLYSGTQLAIVMLALFPLMIYLGKLQEDSRLTHKLLDKNEIPVARVSSDRQLNEELKLLHNELSQCLKRQSPTSFKYYMSENQFRDQQATERTSNAKSAPKKPYRGLVCFGQESRWRQRFDSLKAKYDLDLASLVQEIRRDITNAIIRSKHPALQSTLILDQLEYLQFIENKRNKKQTEETIKYLKAENLQLLRRLNQPSENNYQKLVVSLELKNSRLQRENQALKANLMEKAGTVYMKQSMELEQYERENTMLRQFYQQVAQDVSKSLKQFNLHVMDATQPLDDQEVLNSQLMLTRGYLRKLGEKISSVLLENESLKEELRESYLTSMIAKSTNLQSSERNHNHNNHVALGVSNKPKALTDDSCMRSLLECRQRSDELRREISKLQTDCARCNNVNLEKINLNERHLNRTADHPVELERIGGLSAAKQLADSSSSTAMDKRYRDSLALASEDVVNGLVTFLTKFNNQIESENFAIIESPASQLISDFSIESPALSANNQRPLADESVMKIIPNYIREETRTRPETKEIDGQSVNLKSGVGLPINLGLDLFNHSISSNFYDKPSDSNKQEQTKKLNNVHEADQSEEQLDVFESSSSSAENNTSEPVLEEPDNRSSWVKRVAGDSWFFKRAKQRKHLRAQEADRKDSHVGYSNWAIKRAKLREKLREKMRKAWQYIEKTFSATSGKLSDKHIQSHSRHHHQQHKHNHQQNSRKSSCLTCDAKYHKKTMHHHNTKPRLNGYNLRDEL